MKSWHFAISNNIHKFMHNENRVKNFKYQIIFDLDIIENHWPSFDNINTIEWVYYILNNV